jgi:hypothetical protein
MRSANVSSVREAAVAALPDRNDMIINIYKSVKYKSGNSVGRVKIAEIMYFLGYKEITAHTVGAVLNRYRKKMRLLR